MISLNSLLISPLLPGVIFIIAAFISQRYPPKKINATYGYRTQKSMQNEENWQLANKYSSKLMIKVGVMLALAGLVFSFLVSDMMISGILTAVLTVAAAMMIFFFTERQLK